MQAERFQSKEHYASHTRPHLQMPRTSRLPSLTNADHEGGRLPLMSPLPATLSSSRVGPREAMPGGSWPKWLCGEGAQTRDVTWLLESSLWARQLQGATQRRQTAGGRRVAGAGHITHGPEE